MLIVDGTLVPTRDHTVAEQSKNYRYSTNRQVVVPRMGGAGHAAGQTT
ncbi:putative transposase [Streptomyces hygroscopicus]|nr:putative transposase [Streptomyces hygroscopicus]